jgi:hypothetical protein
MKQTPASSQILEVKQNKLADQAMRLRSMADHSPSEETQTPSPALRESAEVVVISPQSLGDARGLIARCLRRGSRGAVADIEGPDQVAVPLLRSAKRIVVAMGDAPADLAQGLALVRWAASQRLNVQLGVVFVGASSADRAVRHRLRSTLERYISRNDVVTASVRSARIDRTDRRALGRMLTRLEAQWHPVCGGGGL